ncbi:MAG: hypothetical protein KC468_38235, partial [Myxococcales bacterium]|nr:hypothetical protein [Myxococcales bacterium]
DLEAPLRRAADRDAPGRRAALIDELERALAGAEDPLAPIAWLAVSALRVEALLQDADARDEDELVHQYRASEARKERGTEALLESLQRDAEAARAIIQRGHALLRAAGLWRAVGDLGLLATFHARDLRDAAARLAEAREAYEQPAPGPSSEIRDALERLRTDALERVELWAAFAVGDEIAMAALELDERAELIRELGGIFGAARERCGDEHPLWTEFLERLTPTTAWFQRVFKPGAAAAIELIYREAFRPQLGDVARELSNRDRWSVTEVRPSTPARLVAGNQRALFSVMVDDEPLYTLKDGGYSLPNFILEGETLRWLGKMSLSLLHTANQELFELAARGHADGFEQGALRGEAAVKALLEHIAGSVERARA